jgi:predicted dehydrogenase
MQKVARIYMIGNGFHLFIEKPMGMTLHQSQLLDYLARKNSCITQVCHQRRSSPLLGTMREACLAKGPINHAVVEFYKCDIRPMLDARDRLLDDYTHAIDTARWVCGGGGGESYVAQQTYPGTRHQLDRFDALF